MNWKAYRSKILDTIDAEAFYIDELKKKDLVYSRHGHEVKSQCPFGELHSSGADTTPSFTVNLLNGVYFCNACGSKGNIHTFYRMIYKLDKQEAWYALGDALHIERPAGEDTRPAIDPALPATFHRNLVEYTGVAKDNLLVKRGLTEETLKKFFIGWDGDRVTIPIYDEFSDLVNIRRYKWNSFEDNTKMINYTDALENTFGESRLYGIEHLHDDNCKAVMFCEGEWDRLVAEQNNIPSCTSTSGVNNFRQEWLKLLQRKQRVYICFDNDTAGRKATDELVALLRGTVEIYIVVWPEAFPDKGDITDYFTNGGTRDEFRALFKPLETEEIAPIVNLSLSSSARYTGKRIQVPVLVAGKENAPYVYPKAFTATCPAECMGESTLCPSCRVQTAKKVDVVLTNDRPTLLKLINCSDTSQYATLKRLAGIPTKCTSADIKITEYGNLETILMMPKADSTLSYNVRQEYVTRHGYLMGANMPTNKKYMLTGYMHADPNNQRATYIFDKAVPDKDVLDEFEMTEDIYDLLCMFKAVPGQTVKQKFAEIHRDLERNVAYIWDRQKVFTAVDLVYHTALSFTFQEQFIKRGWAECLIIGDSGQAKTTLVERMMAHYKAGELLSGESARRTGLVYSTQQTGSSKSWTLIWGAMPLNDGGLLTVDELSGMAEDDLAKMSDVRSSGIAKATGVITAETTARTRMIFISNPRSGRQLRSENYGVNAVLKLFGKAEDVRRLDFAITVASGEVDADIVNRSIDEMPAVEHVYTTEACKQLVMWAWSRKPENIQFTNEATAAILKHAAAMGRAYSSRIPLVEPADQRLKLARLSIAAAARVFSTADGINLLVKEEHVDFVYEYLTEAYEARSLGYDRYSLSEFESSDTTDGSMSRIRSMFVSLPFINREPYEIIKALYQMPYFNRNVLEDATGLDRDEIKNLMHFLLSNNIAEKAGGDYRRTALGLTFIEACLQEPFTEAEIREARQRRYSKTEM